MREKERERGKPPCLGIFGSRRSLGYTPAFTGLRGGILATAVVGGKKIIGTKWLFIKEMYLTAVGAFLDQYIQYKVPASTTITINL